MMEPKFETIGPNDPVTQAANRLSGHAFKLAAGLGISRWDLCIAMANACGQILADAANPRADPPPGVTMTKRGTGLPREKALERMDHLRTVMIGAYDLRNVEGEG